MHCEQKAVIATPILEVKSETNLNRPQVSIPSTILQLEEVSSTNKCNKQEKNSIHKSLAKMKIISTDTSKYLYKSETGPRKKIIWPWLTCQNIFYGLKSFLEKQR